MTPHPRHGDIQGLGNGSMHVVGTLRTRPQGNPAIGLRHTYRSVLLQGQVGIAFKEEDILEHMGAVRQTLLNVAELVAETFMDIPLFAVVMQARSGVVQGIDGV